MKLLFIGIALAVTVPVSAVALAQELPPPPPPPSAGPALPLPVPTPTESQPQAPQQPPLVPGWSPEAPPTVQGYTYFPPVLSRPGNERPAIDDGLTNWERRPMAIEGVIGFSSPYGPLGVAVDYAFSKWFSLNAGIGSGIGGVQVGVTPRFRLPLGQSVGLSFETGISAGGYRRSICTFFCDWNEGEEVYYKWDTAAWANFGFNVEGRTGGGFNWRVFMGDEKLLNPDSYSCETETGASVSCGKSHSSQRNLPYFGAAFGAAFSTL